MSADGEFDSFRIPTDVSHRNLTLMQLNRFIFGRSWTARWRACASIDPKGEGCGGGGGKSCSGGRSSAAASVQRRL
ncbi:unnamed protein product [Nesidiocoris tenuis]|uniref:Uncharacterized protein n=1 Tax=Nesidiocoris tenuis TaxID=355587 RepID=A0A6H5HTT9_9HEMI|nr:unnamed protein product [Nesidiocoris tenuis]